MSFRVLRMIARLNIGGPAIHTVLLNQGLASRGFESLLLTGSVEGGEGDMSYMAAQRGVATRIIPELGREIRPMDDLVAFMKILKVIREFKPHIVHTHTAKAGLLGRLAAFLSNVPIRVHTYHGHVFSGYFSPVKTASFLHLERLMARVTNRLVALSPLQLDDLTRTYRVATAGRFSMIPLGFDHLEGLFTEGERRTNLRRSVAAGLKMDPESPTVGIVGRLVPIKDHATFLRAAALLSSWMPRVQYLIVGDGPLRQTMMDQAHRLGLSGSVHFMGWQKDLVSVYASMDVACLTSLNEGTPVALIEALAAGVRVVATRVGGVADVLENGRFGGIVPPSDPESLAHRIHAALDEPSVTGDTRRSVIERFGSTRLLDDMEKLYIRLLEECKSKG